MNLAIIPEGPLGFDGKHYLYSEGEGLYIDSIAKYFKEVIVCAYAFHKGDLGYEGVCHYNFKSPNLRFVELPFYRGQSPGMLSKFIQMVKVCKTILGNIKNWDMIYLFLPGFPSAIAYLINKLFRKKYFVYLASEWVEEAPILFLWQGLRKKLFYPFYFKFTEWIERKIVEDAIFVLTAGQATYEKYCNSGKPVYETIPRINYPALDVFIRNDTCLSAPIKLLFVGSLLPRKGAQFLIKATSILKSRKIDVLLTIVGSGPQKEELQNLTHKLDLSQEVKFLGHIPNGPDLWRIYRESDIFILPTPYGEGFPRVLYEAMSQSIPIVTTNVSGIPYKMRHEENALLIPPRNSEAMAEAVERLIKDKELRKRLIKNGQRFMQDMLASYNDNQVHTLLQKHLPEYNH